MAYTTHWFISPHPDDAALSCGGQIAMLAAHGEHVVIVTVMAGDPPSDFAATPFVEELWARWGLALGAEASARRRAEDHNAADALGAELITWEWPDCIYRLNPESGAPLYPDRDAIFGNVHFIADDWMIGQLFTDATQRLPLRAGDQVHVPLGVGNHVDHDIVRTTCFRPDRSLYEEYPYSAQNGAGHSALVQTALDRTGGQLPGLQFAPVLHPIDEAALAAKIAAIGCYQSQISSFWNSIEAMALAVREYTERVGGEREWLLVPQGKSK